MKKIFIFVFCLFFSFIKSPIYAEEIAEEVILYVDQVKIFPAAIPERVVIGKPEIVDVTSVTESGITVAAKKPGSTTFVFWDKFGQQDFRIRVFAEDMSEIKQRIDNILQELQLPNVYTKAVDSEAKVMLLGEVKTSQDRERILAALGTLKDNSVDLMLVKEEEAIVEIDVQVLELNEDATKTLGFTWPGSISISSDVDYDNVSSDTGISPTSWSKLFKVTQWSRTTFQFALNALIQDGKARLLSRPRLACQSNKEAELLVGGEKPILTTTVTEGGASGTEVEYKEYGIKLKIKPTVIDQERIKLALNVEVSDVEDVVILGTTAEPTAKAYPLTKRAASTELYLNDGQTLAIGGLIKQRRTDTIRKTPLLGDIPLLGWFFRKKTTTIGGGIGERADTELFITITPTIIGQEESPKQLAMKEKQELSLDLKSIDLSVMTPELKSYIKAVQNRIAKAVYYPRQAQEASWEGTLRLSLLVSSDGTLKDVKVIKSSGYKILDDVGLKAVSNVAPFPAIPQELDLKELRIEIPIVYHKD